MNIEGLEFERYFVKVVCDLATEKGMSHSELARLAFSDAGSAESKWRKIRNPSGKGKPQSIELAEAVSLAAALGIEFPSLIFRVNEYAKIQKELAPPRSSIAS